MADEKVVVYTQFCESVTAAVQAVGQIGSHLDKLLEDEPGMEKYAGKTYVMNEWRRTMRQVLDLMNDLSRNWESAADARRKAQEEKDTTEPD